MTQKTVAPLYAAGLRANLVTAPDATLHQKHPSSCDHGATTGTFQLQYTL